MPDYSEILIRVAQVQRSLTDALNANDVERARAAVAKAEGGPCA